MILGQAVGMSGKESCMARPVWYLAPSWIRMMCSFVLASTSHKGAIAFGIEPSGLAFPEETTREVINQAEDFVTLALAAGLDRRLVAFGSPV